MQKREREIVPYNNIKYRLKLSQSKFEFCLVLTPQTKKGFQLRHYNMIQFQRRCAISV